jgi:hypothetical protein
VRDGHHDLALLAAVVIDHDQVALGVPTHEPARLETRPAEHLSEGDRVAAAGRRGSLAAVPVNL